LPAEFDHNAAFPARKGGRIEASVERDHDTVYGSRRRRIIWYQPFGQRYGSNFLDLAVKCLRYSVLRAQRYCRRHPGLDLRCDVFLHPDERLLVAALALLFFLLAAWLFLGDVARTVAVDGMVIQPGEHQPERPD